MKPEVFRLAAQKLVNGEIRYACLAIGRAECEIDKISIFIYSNSKYVEFFVNVFMDGSSDETFYSLYSKLEPDNTFTAIEKQVVEMRILACLLAAEMIEAEASIILRFKISIMQSWQKIINFWKKYMVK